jgi:hypothetical protein
MLWLATVSSAVLLVCSPCFSSDLAIELKAVDSVAATDSVVVELTFSNSADSPIVIYQFKSTGQVQAAMNGILHFDIVKDDSIPMAYNRLGFVPLYPHEKDTLVLKAGQSHKELINLTRYYLEPSETDSVIIDSLKHSTRRRWRPGNYAIRCTYEYDHSPTFPGGKALWQGSAQSGAVRVRVK